MMITATIPTNADSASPASNGTVLLSRPVCGIWLGGGTGVDCGAGGTAPVAGVPPAGSGVGGGLSS